MLLFIFPINKDMGFILLRNRDKSNDDAKTMMLEKMVTITDRQKKMEKRRKACYLILLFCYYVNKP
jgi:hypothetical protein